MSGPRAVKWTIRRYGTVASTMDTAADLAAQGAPEGTVVLADRQTSGRGRGGRPWAAGAGESLQATLILRPGVPPARLTTLPLILGVAAAEAIELVAGARCWLKWPNDLWLGDRHRGRKVGGILVEAKAGGTVLAGIGVNVGQGDEDLPEGATSLGIAGASVGRDTLLDALLARVAARYAEFRSGEQDTALDAWTDRAALLGQRVTVDPGNAAPALFGILAGIRDDGAMLIDTDAGGRIAVVAGDLARGPRRAEDAGGATAGAF